MGFKMVCDACDEPLDTMQPHHIVHLASNIPPSETEMGARVIDDWLHYHDKCLPKLR